jgi:predicted esterase
MIERAIAVQIHGRYLVEPPSASGPAPMLVGFHGYAESPEIQLDRLRAIPGADHWLCVAVQGLHRFYQRRTSEIVSSWMTRQDRELAIADNVAFVTQVIAAVRGEWPHSSTIVYAGFSQGVAMAYRAAAAARPAVAGVISVGGDVPPELDALLLSHVPAALLCRGNKDLLYEKATYENDQRRLQEAGTSVRPIEFDGGHEWAADVLSAASQFLRERRP